MILRIFLMELIGAMFLLLLGGTGEGGQQIYYKHAVWITGVTGMIAVIPMLFLYRKDVSARKMGGLIRGNVRLRIAEIALLLGMGAALSQFVNIFMQVFAEVLDFAQYAENMNHLTADQGILAQIFWMGMIAPFAEEVVFRWMVYLRLRDYYRRGWAVVISGLIFGICHWNLLQAVYATIMGIMFAYILEWSGNIWSSVLLHMGANTWSLVYPEIGWFLVEKGQAQILLFFTGILCAVMVMGIRYFIDGGQQRGNRGV